MSNDSFNVCDIFATTENTIFAQYIESRLKVPVRITTCTWNEFWNEIEEKNVRYAVCLLPSDMAQTKHLTFTVIIIRRKGCAS